MKRFKNGVRINYVTFGKWLIYYYHVWFEKELTCILCKFDDFHLEKYLFNYNLYKQFNGDIWRY